MAVTMESTVFMGKNYQNNCNSIAMGLFQNSDFARDREDS